MRHLTFLLALLSLATLAACSTPDAAPPVVDAEQGPAPAVTIDSAIPSAERLRRFRATVGVQPDTLRHASPSMDALVRRWARAIQARDTAALNAMVLDRAEFAWLFYPTNKLARPPYEMPPALMWESILANSDAGVRRALDRLAGRPLAVRAIRCPGDPTPEGDNRVHEGCLLTLDSGGQPIVDARVFGSVVERQGRFKFLGYANRM